MKLHLTVEIDERTADLVADGCIERCINTSVAIARASGHEDAYVNQEDWRRCKPVVDTLWRRLQDALYRHRSGLEPQSSAVL